MNATARVPRNAAAVRATRERALQSLDALPRLDCAVLALLLVEKLSLIETANALGVPVTTVRRRYDSALARVRRALDPLLARPRAPRRVVRETTVMRRAS